MSTPLVDEGALLLAEVDQTLCEWDRRILRALRTEHHPVTLDTLADWISVYPSSRPLIFAAVARLENAGWIPWGAIR